MDYFGVQKFNVEFEFFIIRSEVLFDFIVIVRAPVDFENLDFEPSLLLYHYSD